GTFTLIRLIQGRQVTSNTLIQLFQVPLEMFGADMTAIGSYGSEFAAINCDEIPLDQARTSTELHKSTAGG
ncbi:hypothetical protein TZ03_09360, partial [Pseudomonas sp. 10-1B]